jgi:hypothetical protein
MSQHHTSTNILAMIHTYMFLRYLIKAHTLQPHLFVEDPGSQTSANQAQNSYLHRQHTS